MKIPIANIYYLLCYAWGHADQSDLVSLSELRGLEQVHDLLGKVIAHGTRRLVKQGLARDYLDCVEDLAGVRGKILPSEMVKRAVRSSGRVTCKFGELSVDTTENRILKATLGLIEGVDGLDQGVRREVREARRRLAGVADVALDRRLFAGARAAGNRRLYRFLISLCLLAYESSLVDQEDGVTRIFDFRDDEAQMWRIFEEFVTQFYAREQIRYTVNRKGRAIQWADVSAASETDRAHIPRMEADLILEATDRRIILDCKFYREAFSSRGASDKLHSGNLYQILTYLRNREETVPAGPRHDGVLLYPVVDKAIGVDVQLEGFRVQARGVNLAREWWEIRDEMLAVVN